MNKQKFEAFLRSELRVLQTSEIDEIVLEYLQHIDMKVSEGVSEQEAIADFGDLNDLVDDLLSAYKINNRERTFNNIEFKAKSFLNRILNFMNSIVSSIMSLPSKQIITLIVEFILVIILLGLLNSIVSRLFYSVLRLFYFRPYFITGIIRLIVSLVEIVVTTSLSLIVLYWFAQERIIDKEVDHSYRKTEERQSKKDNNDNLNASEAKLNDISVNKVDKSQEKDINFSKSDEQFRKTSEVTQKLIKEKPNKDHRLDKTLMSILSVIFRSILIIFLIPFIVLNVLVGIAYAYLIYATLMGYGSLGLSIVGFGILLMSFSTLIFLISLVGGKKDEEVHNNI